MLNIDHTPCGSITDPHGRVHNIYRIDDEIYIADMRLVGRLQRPPQNETHFYFAGRLYPKSIATRGNNP
jgi:hypothetical protein